MFRTRCWAVTLMSYSRWKNWRHDGVWWQQLERERVITVVLAPLIRKLNHVSIFLCSCLWFAVAASAASWLNVDVLRGVSVKHALLQAPGAEKHDVFLRQPACWQETYSCGNGWIHWRDILSERSQSCCTQRFLLTGSLWILRPLLNLEIHRGDFRVRRSSAHVPSYIWIIFIPLDRSRGNRFLLFDGRSWIMIYTLCTMPDERSDPDGRKSCCSWVRHSFHFFQYICPPCNPLFVIRNSKNVLRKQIQPRVTPWYLSIKSDWSYLRQIYCTRHIMVFRTVLSWADDCCFSTTAA